MSSNHKKAACNFELGVLFVWDGLFFLSVLLLSAILNQQTLLAFLCVVFFCVCIFYFFLFFPVYFLQIEPIPSGNLPPGFDATSCRSVWVCQQQLHFSFLILFYFTIFYLVFLSDRFAYMFQLYLYIHIKISPILAVNQ